ncbi:DUF7096 domain-containing protein [Halorubrum salinum]|uniref:DUF7096 domain-containing protein n=1 Tax=Halorubrum salinum TaxID=767517 RepID=UPI0021135844|nr:hypothetical protein [Halorubrum salinum]
MNRGIALVVVAVAVVGLVGVAAAGPVGTAVAQDDPATNGTDANGTSETDANGTSETGVNDGDETDTSAEGGGTDIAPGERFSGVVGVQQAEIAGEVSSRSFEIALDRADTDAERAAVVAERLNRTEDQLGSIERRQRELRERRDAGELSQGAFAARMAEIGARAESARREVNRSADVAERLPEPARAQRGLDEKRLNAVRRQASDLSGPEVAAMARGIAGNETGRPLAADRRGPPARRGPPDDAANGTDSDQGPPGATDRPGAGRPTDAGNGTDAAPGRGNDTGVQGLGPENASQPDRTAGARGADGPPGNGSARDGGSASDDTPGNGASGGANPGNGGSEAGPPDRGGSDGDGSASDGSASGGSADGESGGDGSASDDSADGGSGGDGSAGRGSGAESNPGRDRPLLDSLDAAGAFLRSAWSGVAAI